MGNSRRLAIQKFLGSRTFVRLARDAGLLLGFTLGSELTRMKGAGSWSARAFLLENLRSHFSPDKKRTALPQSRSYSEPKKQLMVQPHFIAKFEC